MSDLKSLAAKVFHNNRSCRDGLGKDGGLTASQLLTALRLVGLNCPVTGKPLFSSDGQFFGSLDRIRSDYRYHAANIWFTHVSFNAGKGDKDIDPKVFKGFLETEGLTIEIYEKKSKEFTLKLNNALVKLGLTPDRPLALVDRSLNRKKK